MCHFNVAIHCHVWVIGYVFNTASWVCNWIHAAAEISDEKEAGAEGGGV